jgi:hypothetical protein
VQNVRLQATVAYPRDSLKSSIQKTGSPINRLTKTAPTNYSFVLRHPTQLNLPPEGRWILPGIIPLNGLVVIASAPKTGKTVLVNAIAHAMATGGTFADFAWEDKIPIAWCSHEESIEERAPLMQRIKEEDPYYLAIGPELPFLDDPDCDYGTDRHGRYQPLKLPYVYNEAAKIRAGLMVIDCLHSAVRHSNLADNQVARRIMGKLRHWSNSFGIATVVLHHLTKSAHRGYHPERFADSAQILASASCYFFMESETLDDGTRKIILSGAGRQPAPPARQELIATSLFDYKFVKAEPTPKRPSMAEQIKNLLEQGWELTAEDIAKRLALNPASVITTVNRIPGITKTKAARKVRYRLEQSAETQITTDEQ